MRLDCTNLIKPTPNVIHRVLPFVTILREFIITIVVPVNKCQSFGITKNVLIRPV